MGSLVLISLFIIPRMTEMFTTLNDTVPAGINRVLSFSKGIFSIFLAAVPFMTLLSLAAHFIRRRNKNTRKIIDSLRFKIPLLGSFIKDNQFLNILFTLGVLTSCGTSVEDALLQVINTAGNTAVKEAFGRVHKKVIKGGSLSEALFDEEIIPLRISRWVAVGEKTGSMGTVFNQLSEYYENEVEKKSTRFMNLIEPALILFTGLIVLAVVLLIIVPLFSAFGNLLE